MSKVNRYISQYLLSNMDYVIAILDYVYYNSNESISTILEYTTDLIKSESLLFLKEKKVSVVYRAIVLEKIDAKIGIDITKNDFEEQINSWSYNTKFIKKYAKNIYDNHNDEYNDPCAIIITEPLNKLDVILSIEYIISQIIDIENDLPEEYFDILEEVKEYYQIEAEIICSDKPLILSDTNFIIT